MVRTATPTPGIAPSAGRGTRAGGVHCLRIGCSTHAHKHNRGERPATVHQFRT